VTAEDYEATSERMQEDAYVSSPGDFLIYALHVATYDWAARRADGAAVLDYGCGTGYGVARLAESAASVVGVDVSAAAVSYAESRYPAENARFQQIAPIEQGPLPFPDGSFDLVTSFQVIEHVPSPDAYVAEVRRVLKPGGTFLCVTPDRATRLFPRQRPWNVWHLHEFTPAELVDVVGRHLPVEETLGMSARPEVIRLEIDRCRKVRLAAYPFTFPGAPEKWRQWGLNLLKSLNRPASGSSPEKPDFGFGVEDVEISANAAPSVNIVVIARR
jgi:SAM-dependent methyltransferase